MFTKWFGTRTLRQPAKAEYFFRPELEALEDRLPPSSLQGMGGNNGNGSDHVNIHDNIHITNSFNGSTLTNSFNGMFPGVFFLGQGQQAAVGQLLALSSLLATELSNSNLGSLIDDEVALAVDTVLFNQGLSSVIPTLKGDISMLNTAIAANPLSNTPIGQAVGMLAFDATMDALTAAQPKF